MNSMQAIKTISSEYRLSEESILKESLTAFLEKKLREIKVELYRIYGKYKVTSVEALESQFESGIIEEKDALDDYHKLDHLEFKRNEIVKMLQELQ